jgi:hypothetical protein
MVIVSAPLDDTAALNSGAVHLFVGPVGGVAEPPDVAGTPLETREPPSPNPGFWAVVMGSLAAGTTALLCAAWYARRRLTR